jgi:hypothetical protein
MDCHGCYTLG